MGREEQVKERAEQEATECINEGEKELTKNKQTRKRTHGYNNQGRHGYREEHQYVKPELLCRKQMGKLHANCGAASAASELGSGGFKMRRTHKNSQ